MISTDLPLIVQTYLPACKTVAQPPGFGDFLRGALALFQFSKKYNFNLFLDYSAHPISNFLTQSESAPCLECSDITEFFNDDVVNLEPFLSCLSGRAIKFLCTHAVPLGLINEDALQFIRNRILPTSSFQSHLSGIRAEFDLNCYCTLHLRLGDKMMGKIAPPLPMIDTWIERHILPRWGNNVLLISDSYEVKNLLSKRYNLKAMQTVPVHLGAGAIDCNNINVFRDTLLDFFLMAESERIYLYSVYPWGSGFSEICSTVFSIPLEKFSLTSSVNERIIMSSSDNSSISAGNHCKKVLNVGGNNKSIPIPHCYDGWQHDLLDIDPRGKPDVLCDARELWKLPPRQYDSVYCSHNLEHYHRHDAEKVLKGIRTVIKKNGFILIRVPDFKSVTEQMLEQKLDIDDVLYESPSGPILVRDVFWGWHVEIENSGNDFFAHKTGFTSKSLKTFLEANGYCSVNVWVNKDCYELLAIAFISAGYDNALNDLIIALGLDSSNYKCEERCECLL